MTFRMYILQIITIYYIKWYVSIPRYLTYQKCYIYTVSYTQRQKKPQKNIRVTWN